MKEEFSDEVYIIDWENEKEKSMIFESYIPLEELPF